MVVVVAAGELVGLRVVELRAVVYAQWLWWLHGAVQTGGGRVRVEGVDGRRFVN